MCYYKDPLVTDLELSLVSPCSLNGGCEEKNGSDFCLLHARFLLALLANLEGGGDGYIHNIG
jgi:hypothetical protein